MKNKKKRSSGGKTAMVVLCVCLGLILTVLLGVTGIQMAQAVSDLLTLLCAIPIHLHVLKTMERE